MAENLKGEWGTYFCFFSIFFTKELKKTYFQIKTFVKIFKGNFLKH